MFLSSNDGRPHSSPLLGWPSRQGRSPVLQCLLFISDDGWIDCLCVGISRDVELSLPAVDRSSQGAGWLGGLCRGGTVSVDGAGAMVGGHVLRVRALRSYLRCRCSRLLPSCSFRVSRIDFFAHRSSWTGAVACELDCNLSILDNGLVEDGISVGRYVEALSSTLVMLAVKMNSPGRIPDCHDTLLLLLVWLNHG